MSIARILAASALLATSALPMAPSSVWRPKTKPRAPKSVRKRRKDTKSARKKNRKTS